MWKNGKEKKMWTVCHSYYLLTLLPKQNIYDSE